MPDISQEKKKLFIEGFLNFFREFLIASLKVRRERISHYFIGVFKARRNAFPSRKGPTSLPDSASFIDSCNSRSSLEFFLGEIGPSIKFLGIFIRMKSFVVSTAGAITLFIYLILAVIHVNVNKLYLAMDFFVYAKRDML